MMYARSQKRSISRYLFVLLFLGLFVGLVIANTQPSSGYDETGSFGTGGSSYDSDGSCQPFVPGMRVSGSVVLCPGNYTHPDGSGPSLMGYSVADIVITEDNTILDCAGADIYGVGLGVDVSGHKNVTIRNCKFYNYDRAIYFHDGASGRVEGNMFFHVGTAVHDEDSEVTVSENGFFGGDYGVYQDDGHVDVEDNNFFDVSTGVYLTSGGNRVLNNRFRSNSYDIYLNISDYTDCDNEISDNLQLTNVFRSVPILYVKDESVIGDQEVGELVLCNADHSVVRNVTIRAANPDSKSNGLFLIFTDYADIEDVDSRYNYVGISLIHSTNNVIKDSYLSTNSKYGMYISSDSVNNSIIGNRLCGNGEEDVYDESLPGANEFSDNTCDSGVCDFSCGGMICTDVDRDGFGVCPDCGVDHGCLFDGNDCNDLDPGIPTDEVCDNGRDDDCDGLVDDYDPDCWYVDLDDPTTWDPDRNGIDNVYEVNGEYHIVEDVRLVRKVYNIPAESPAISVDCDDCVLDCNLAMINGTHTGTGILVNGHDNVTVKNCVVRNYQTGIDWSGSNNGNLMDNKVCYNYVDIHLSTDSHDNDGDNTCGTLEDEDTNSVTCSNSCFSTSDCVDFSRPATWDWNNNGLPDIVQTDYMSYEIVEDTRVCPNQEFVQIVVDDNVSMGCGVGRKFFGTGNQPIMNAKTGEVYSIVLGDNSEIHDCNFAGHYAQKVLINGSGARLLRDKFYNYSLVVRGDDAHVISNKFHGSEEGILLDDVDGVLLFDNEVDGPLFGISGVSRNGMLSCNRLDADAGISLNGESNVVEYNSIFGYSTGINYTGSGMLLYNIIQAPTGIVGSSTGSVLIGNMLDYRYGTVSIDWSGNDVFVDNAFCSGSTSFGTPDRFEDNYCEDNPECEPCETYDDAVEDLTCPYEYNDTTGKLVLVSQEPVDYDHTEIIDNTTYYVYEVNTSQDLTSVLPGVPNRYYPLRSTWDNGSFVYRDVDWYNITEEVSGMSVSYSDTLDHTYTEKDNEYYAHIYPVDKPYVIGGINYKFLIVNSPPEIVNMSPENESEFISGVINLSADAVDPDGDVLSYEYHVLYPNGTEVVITLGEGEEYSEVYGPGEYEWWVVVSDGTDSVESDHYWFTVNRHGVITEMMFRPVGDGSLPGEVDTLDDLRCSVRVDGLLGYDYDGVKFRYYVNDVLVYQEVVTTPDGEWFTSVLGYGNTSKHDNVTCSAVPVWDNGLGSYNWDDDEWVNSSLLVVNTPPEITSLLPENHTTHDEFVPVGIVRFNVTADDVDNDGMTCHLVVIGITDPGYLYEDDQTYSDGCVFDVSLDVGEYEWYVKVSDGETEVESEHRHLNVAPLHPYVDHVDLIQVGGHATYWDTYDDMLVNITLGNVSTGTVAHLIIGKNCDYVNGFDDYSCDVLVDEVIPCETGSCDYTLSHDTTEKHDNLTVMVRAETTGTWVYYSEPWMGSVVIENLPPTVVLISPENDTNLTVFDTLTYVWSGSDDDGDDLSYTVYVYNSSGDLVYTHSGSDTEVSDGYYPVGDYEWYVVADDGDDQTESDHWYFHVLDPRPSGEIEVVVYPEPGTGYLSDRIETFDDLRCNVTVSGDADYLIVEWLRNGEVVYSEQVDYDNWTGLFSHDNTTKHDVITCRARAMNVYPGAKANYYSDYVNDSVEILNIPPEPPVLISPENGSVLRDRLVELNATYEDPDVEGDPVSIHYFVRRIPLPDYTEVSSPVMLDPGAYEWYAVTYDGEEYSEESVHWYFQISNAVILPDIDNLTIMPEDVYTDSDMVCSFDLYGYEDVDVEVVWEVRHPGSRDWEDTGYGWTYSVPGDRNWHHYETPAITGMTHYDTWRCVVRVNSTELDHVSTEILNTPPVIDLVSPDNDSLTDTEVEFTWSGDDIDGDDLTYTLYVDGTPVYTGSEVSYEYDVGEGDHEWYVVVSDGDDHTESEHWLIHAVEFPCPVVEVVPEEPGTLDDLVCRVTGDVSGLSTVGTVYAHIVWLRNGEDTGLGDDLPCGSGCESVLTHDHTEVGDNWTCEVRYYVEWNGNVYLGNCVANDTVEIVNHLPEITLIRPADGDVFVTHTASGVDVEFTWTGSDEDGNPLDYVITIINRDTGDERSVDMGSLTDYTSNLLPGEYEWYVNVSDGYDVVESDHWTFMIYGEIPCDQLTVDITDVNGDQTVRAGHDMIVHVNTTDTAREMMDVWGVDPYVNLTCRDTTTGDVLTDYASLDTDDRTGYEYVIPGDDVHEGDEWFCTAHIRDHNTGRSLSCAQSDDVVVAGNRPPEVVLLTPEDATVIYTTDPGVDVQFGWSGGDPDGDEISYVFVIYPVGGPVGITPTPQQTIPTSDESVTVHLAPGAYEWYVNVSDGFNTVTSVVWQLTVLPNMSGDHLTLTHDPDEVYSEDEVDVILTVDDELIERATGWGTTLDAHITCEDDQGHVVGDEGPLSGNQFILHIPSDQLVPGAEWSCTGNVSLSGAEMYSDNVYDGWVVGDHPPEVTLISPEDGWTHVVSAGSGSSNFVDFSWDVDDVDSDEISCTLYLEHDSELQEFYTGPETIISVDLDVFSDVNGEYEWWVNCTDGIQEVTSDHWRFTYRINHAPTVSLIGPCDEVIEAEPDGTIDVTFRWSGEDVDGDELSYRLVVNGLSIDVGSDEEYTMEELTPGEYEWTVIASDGYETSSASCTFTITEFHNDPPVVREVYIHEVPSDPMGGVYIRCFGRVDDPDNDEVTVFVHWYVNGEHVEEYDHEVTCESGEPCVMEGADIPTGECQNITCELVAYDGFDYSEPKNSSEWSNWEPICSNHEPVITLVSPEDGQEFEFTGGSSPRVVFNWRVDDPDGETPVCTLHILHTEDEQQYDLETPYYFAIIDLSVVFGEDYEGDYEWWVDCRDAFVDVESEHRTFHVEYVNAPPEVVLVSPEEDEEFTFDPDDPDTQPVVSFDWEVSDPDDVVVSCNLYITNKRSGQVVQITTGTSTEADVNLADYFTPWYYHEGTEYEWWVVCSDDESSTESVHRRFSLSPVNHEPTIVLLTPEQEDTVCIPHGEDIKIHYTWDGEDSDGDPLDYWLVVTEHNSVTGNTETSIHETEDEEYYLAADVRGIYEWYVNVSDGYDVVQSDTWRFEVLTQPYVSAINYHDGSEIGPGEHISLTVYGDEHQYSWDGGEYQDMDCHPFLGGYYICEVYVPDDIEYGDHVLTVRLNKTGEFGYCDNVITYHYTYPEPPGACIHIRNPSIQVITRPTGEHDILCSVDVESECGHPVQVLTQLIKTTEGGYTVVDSDTSDPDYNLHVEFMRRDVEPGDYYCHFHVYDWYGHEKDADTETVHVDDTTLQITSPENGTLFIEESPGSDVDVEVSWRGEADEVCVYPVGNPINMECTAIDDPITEHTTTITLHDTPGWTNQDYVIEAHGHDGMYVSSVIVTLAEDVTLVAPKVNMFELSGGELVCEGTVIAGDDRVLGQTRSVVIYILDPENRIIGIGNGEVVLGSDDVVRATASPEEEGLYRCTVSVTYYDGSSGQVSETYYVEDLPTAAGSGSHGSLIHIPVKPVRQVGPKVPDKQPVILPMDNNHTKPVGSSGSGYLPVKIGLGKPIHVPLRGG